MNGDVLWAPLHFGVTWSYLGTSWVSFGCHLGVTWCHLVIIWVSLGCPMVVTWVPLGCHLSVTQVSLRCNFDVTGCHFKWHLIGDYSVTIGRMYLCPVGNTFLKTVSTFPFLFPKPLLIFVIEKSSSNCPFLPCQWYSESQEQIKNLQ